MRHLAIACIVIEALALIACSGEPIEEQVGSSEDPLVQDCLAKSGAKPGSSDFGDALRDCIKREVDNAKKPGDTKPGDAKPGDTKPGDAKPGDKPGDAKPGDKPGDKSCSIAVSCVNGACTCATEGAAKGKACDGKTQDKADSCQVLCKSCL
ncbi:MAG: hypothetical protein R3B36_16965 [Polyangiaceae bacterium]